MRRIFAAALSAAALFAAGPVAADNHEPGWSYAYADGVAAATMTDDRGRVEATLTCSPPTGDLIITDYTLERQARRASAASVRLGALTINVPASQQRVGRKRPLVVPLPQRPPILAAVQPTDQLVVTVNNHEHVFREGAAKQMQDVAYACWGGPS
jgi:hypothetical protein